MIITSFLTAHYNKANAVLSAEIFNHPQVSPPRIVFFSGSSSNQNSLRRPLIAPKLRTINSNEQLSSSDSNGSIRKNLIDKSTMTMAEKNAKINRYATWNK
jgi:hypothetical protein